MQRGVRARHGNSTRAAGDAPAIGRVSRMPGQEPAKGRRRSRGGGAPSPRAKASRAIVIGWSIALGLLSLAVLVGVMVWWIAGNRAEPLPAAVVAAPAAAAKVEPRLTLRPTPDEAMILAKRAMAARSESEIAERILPGNASNREIVAFLEALPETEGEVTGYTLLQSADTNGLEIETVVVAFSHPDGGSTNRIAMFTPVDGRWMMDFAAFARRTEPPIDEFLAGSGDTCVVRVYVEPDTFYNGHFADEAVWNSYAVASPDVERLMIGYCRDGSLQDRAVRRIIAAKSGRPARATLELRRVEGASDRQFEISGVLAEDWVFVGDRYEDRVR